jgi:hypothetical protein
MKNQQKTNKIFRNTGHAKRHLQTNFGPENIRNKSK